MDYPDPSQPSAEEIAERMAFVDDEECLCSETVLSALAIVNSDPAAAHETEGQHATLGDQSGAGHDPEKCYCCHFEEDDPAVIAENEGFYPENCGEMEDATAQEELLLDSDLENADPQEQNEGNTDKMGILRKRNTKGIALLAH